MADVATAAPGGPPSAPGNAQPGQGQPASSAKPGETPAQAEARRVKLLLDGQERELPESEVVAKFKRGEQAQRLLSDVDRKRQEAIKAKAEAEGLLNRLKDKGNLREVLLDLGYTREEIRKFSESDILEAIQEERLTPDQRRAKELEAKLRQHETEKQKQEREKQEAQQAEEMARYKDEFANLFVQTMETHGLPRESGRHLAPRMAALYLHNQEAGLDATVEEMAEHVMAGMKKEHSAVLSGLKGEALLEHLGEAVVKEVLRTHLEKARAKRGLPQQQAQSAPQSKPAQPQQMDPRRGRWALIESQYLGGKK